MNNEKKNGLFVMNNINLSIRDLLKKKIIEKERKLRTERLNNINNKRFNEDYEYLNNKKNMQLDDLSSNEINLDTYIENIINNFKDNNEEYIYQSLNDYHISFCPKCSFPVLSIGNYVLCCNKCFKFEIDSNCFNEKFTLDNLMDNYLQTLKKHSQCNSDISFLYFDNNNFLFYCSECLNNYFL